MVMLLLAASAVSCRPDRSEFRIVDYRQPGDATAYAETFDEAYYRLDAAGNVDVVLRRRQVGSENPARGVMQVIHIKSFWKPIPGRTVAERSQINATVSYLIMSGNLGAAFEGAGSVFFRKRWIGGGLTGSLERAFLTPQRRLNGGRALFSRAELSGTFTAQRDPRRVVRILNTMDRLFGPMPRYEPPDAVRP